MPPRTHLLHARVLGAVQKMRDNLGDFSPRELLYQGIFRDAAAALRLPLPPLFPLGGAANYSLLYTILRVLVELRCARLLEIGVGQSTLLVNAIRKMRGDLDAVSIDADAGWSHRIGSQVDHPVLHAPLVRKSLHGIETLGFDLPKLEGKFDMVVVDGPLGTKRHSRWAALEVLDQYLSDEFVVVFDDAERIGEQDTIQEFVRSSGQRKLRSRFIQATKAQCLLFTPQFQPAMFY